MKRIALIGIILLCAGQVWGATYTVCASGCSYTTLQDASNAADDDDIIDGLGNTFNAALIAAGSGTSGHPIIYRNFTVNAAGLGSIGINGGAWAEGNYTTWQNVNVINADATYNGWQFYNNVGVILTNCSATGTGGSGLLFGANASGKGNLTVTGGTYSGNADNGIIVYGKTGAPLDRLTNISITGVTASSNLGAGIYVIRSIGVLIDSNTTDSNGSLTDASEDYGIALNCSDSATVTRNIITNTVNDGGAGFQVYSDATDGSNNDFIFSRNLISGTTNVMPCVSITPLGNSTATGMVISYNIISGCSGHGLSFYHEGAGSPATISVYNNTIAGTTGNLVYGGKVFNLVFKNNIFSGGAAPSVELINSTPGFITTSNNLWYRSSGNVLAYNGSTYTTANIATFEATAVYSDPLLTSNYRLNGNSPAINAGVDVGITTDFAGNPIVGLPDIGAFEAQYPKMSGVTFSGGKLQ